MSAPVLERCKEALELAREALEGFEGECSLQGDAFRSVDEALIAVMAELGAR